MPSMSVFLLFFAAAAAVPDNASRAVGQRSVGARAEATATVRIVSGARVALSETQDSALPSLQSSSIRAEDGSLRPARLVEFN